MALCSSFFISSLNKFVPLLSGDDDQTLQENDSHTPRKPNSKAFECPECSRTFFLTPVEILKHKKQHASGSSNRNT